MNAARKGMLESHETFAAILQLEPGNKDWAREQLSSDERIGLITGDPDFLNLGDRKTAAKWLQRMADDCERIRAIDSNDVRAITDLSDADADLGAVYTDSNPARAEKLYQASLSLRRSALQSAPNDPEKLYTLSFDEISFATLLRGMGKRADAMKQLRTAIENAQGLVHRDPGEISFGQLLGLGLQRRGALLLKMGRVKEARLDLQQSDEILSKLYRENPNNLLILRDLANCYRAKGDLAASQSRWTEAGVSYQKNLDLWENWTRIGKSSAYDQKQREIAFALVRKAHSRP